MQDEQLRRRENREDRLALAMGTGIVIGFLMGWVMPLPTVDDSGIRIAEMAHYNVEITAHKGHVDKVYAKLAYGTRLSYNPSPFSARGAVSAWVLERKPLLEGDLSCTVRLWTNTKVGVLRLLLHETLPGSIRDIDARPAEDSAD